MATNTAQHLYLRLNEEKRLTVDELSMAGLPADEAAGQIVESEWELAGLLARAAGCEVMDLSQVDFQREALKSVPAKLARATHILPLYVEDDELVAAQYDPLDMEMADKVRRRCRRNLRIVCVPYGQLLHYLESQYGSHEREKVEQLVERSRSEAQARRGWKGHRQRGLFAEHEPDLGSTPVEQLVDAIIGHALKQRATDVHITCHGERTELKYRVDGVLGGESTIPADIHESLISRIKLNAGMDISNRKFPQEGKFETEIGDRVVQVRASVFPTVNGEEIALRLLHQSMYLKDLSALGFSGAKLEAFSDLLDREKGMILVTGPVGVGKTTTLYSALNRISKGKRKVITLEDPIECRLEGMVQSQISPQTGYDFAMGLRSILRMDPNVIMVGEIRDVETARMALRASLTGMLVMSTLHTDRAAGAVPRLLDMEVEPYLLTSSLLGVLSQGLVRKICEECKTPAEPDIQLIRFWGLPRELEETAFWRGAGCERCNYTGYYGRTGIFELLRVDDEMRQKINRSVDTSEIETLARRNKMQTMLEDGLEKARNGITTLEESLRAVPPQIISRDVREFFVNYSPEENHFSASSPSPQPASYGDWR